MGNINKQCGGNNWTPIMLAVYKGNTSAVRVLGRMPRVQWSKEDLIRLARQYGESSMLPLLEELDQERKKVSNDAVVRAETERKRKEEETRRQREEKMREEERTREEEQFRQAKIIRMEKERKQREE